jgi:hypothetical protein|tara:strand:- start:3899 stop:4162 length:264 start_codon:yes stop_codon:yes gene_type:complete
MSKVESKNKVMKLSNLNSQVSLREWLKSSLHKSSGSPLYKHDDIISNNDMLIFLNYIDRQINDQMPQNHREWMGKIKSIRERIEKNE